MNPKCLTIARPVECTGIGLHSGESTRVRLVPRETPGIEFIRTDLPAHPTLRLRDADRNGPPMRTRLASGNAEVFTVEHLLAALAGMNIWAVTVECDGAEMPAMDGSALPFAQLIQNAGSRAIAADEDFSPVVIPEVRRFGDDSAYVLLQPPSSAPSGLELEYELFYENNPLAQGKFEISLNSENFFREVAPARTFVMKADAQRLLAAGFGKGANPENTVIVDGDKPSGTVLRFEDEPVRHKVLDLLGDLTLAGRPLVGRVSGYCSGHRQNRDAAHWLASL